MLASLYLPRLHRGVGYELKPVSASTVQRSGLGGSLSPISRAGDHWAVEIDVGQMAVRCARSLLADVVRGSTQKMRVILPQHGIDVPASWSAVPHEDGTYFSDGGGYVTAPHVKGDGQAGSSLSISGGVPGAVLKKGNFITVRTPDGFSAHLVTESVAFDASGDAVVAFWPMLWMQPHDADAVEIHKPFLEGFVVDSGGQSSALFPTAQTDSFVVEEG